MKYSLSIIIIFLLGQAALGQIKSIVINSETKAPIPYVNIWVENENIGTTSDEQGMFILNINDISKTIVLSAIGYATKKIKLDSIGKTVELSSQMMLLPEVVIHSKKNSQELIIGEFKKSKISSFYACGIVPWMVARQFAFDEKYRKTPFLKKIEFLTDSRIANAKFNIRLYAVNKNGNPEGFIYDQNIFGFAKKGRRITEVDLSSLNIEFPKNGFFIAVEWLIIEDNKAEYTYTMNGSKEKLKAISYEPAFGTVPDETNENAFRFSQGNWARIMGKGNSQIKAYQDKYSLLAMELTLTN